MIKIRIVNVTTTCIITEWSFFGQRIENYRRLSTTRSQSINTIFWNTTLCACFYWIFLLNLEVRLVPLSSREGTSPVITIAIIVRDPSNSSQETAGPQSPKKLGAHQQQPVKQVCIQYNPINVIIFYLSKFRNFNQNVIVILIHIIRSLIISSVNR